MYDYKERGHPKLPLITLVLLLLIINLANSQPSEVTYQETEQKLVVIQGDSYNDGSICLRLAKQSQFDACNEPKLYLRIIHSDGNVKQLHLDDIPTKSFCKVNSPGSGGGNSTSGGTTPTDLEDGVTIFAISKEYILITYYCTDASNGLCGRVVNWNGETKDIIQFDDECANRRIVKSTYADGGFLYACYKQEMELIEWKTYTAPSIVGGKVSQKNSGSIPNIVHFDVTHIFATENRGYSVVTGTNISAQWKVWLYFIPTNGDHIKGPFQIYLVPQPKDTFTTFLIKRCNIAYQTYGYSCLIYYENTTEKSFVNIDFISSGAVKGIQKFQVNQLISSGELRDVKTLYRGGYCIIIRTPDNNVQGFAYSNYGVYGLTWGLPSKYTYKIFGVNTDNTVWAIVDTSNNAVDTNQWTCVFSTALKSYSTIQGDVGYETTSIVSTNPGRNATVTPDTRQITITYTTDIGPSTGSIMIYQKNPEGNENDILRQKAFASNPNDVSIIGNQMFVRVEDHTFDRYNTTYTIVVDDDAVEVGDRQNLIGVKADVWQVTTPPGNDNRSGDTKAIILLTGDGTKEYLSNKDRKTYVTELSTEITNALTIEEGRIFIPHDIYQYFKNVPEDQILLRVDIKGSKTPNEPSSFVLRNDLDRMILGDILTGPRTNELDIIYGAPETPDLWGKYRWILFVTAFVLLFLTIIWFIAWRKGRNFGAIFFIPIFLIDFTLDILVLAFHGRDLKWFYMCCLVFLLVPMLFKIIIAWIIIYNLSYIDLKFLSSRCTGNLGFSKGKGRKQIVIYAILVVFIIEDLPQLIIYSLYQRYTVVPAIIPILSFSSACIIILLKTILICIFKPDRSSVLVEKG